MPENYRVDPVTGALIYNNRVSYDNLKLGKTVKDLEGKLNNLEKNSSKKFNLLEKKLDSTESKLDKILLLLGDEV